MNIYVLAGRLFERCARRRRVVSPLVMVLGACAILVGGVGGLQAQGAKRGKDDDLRRYNGSWVVTRTNRSGECTPPSETPVRSISYTLDILHGRITAHGNCGLGGGYVAPSVAAHWIVPGNIMDGCIMRVCLGRTRLTASSTFITSGSPNNIKNTRSIPAVAHLLRDSVEWNGLVPQAASPGPNYPHQRARGEPPARSKSA